MSLDNYLFYVLIAAMTIATPGPGVIMTLTNSMRYGLLKTFAGVFGIALGMFSLALLSSSGLGLLMATSAKAYLVLKIVGAVYLLYLGVKLLKNRKLHLDLSVSYKERSANTLFFQGLGITLLNPKPIVFFTALFPQFIVSDAPYNAQFLLLAVTFCLLIFMIHFLYALFVRFFCSSGDSAFTTINTVGGVAYIGFAVALLFSKK